jgi:neutral ceramidase
MLTDRQNSFDTVGTPLTDTSVKSYHIFQDMEFYEFPLPNGTVVQTCPAALGYSFAAGTTDGPGAFDFVQNDNNSAQNPFWAIVSDTLTTPTPQQVSSRFPVFNIIPMKFNATYNFLLGSMPTP